MKNYYCDGICETCEMGKHYGKSNGGFDTCNEEKMKGLRPIMINALHLSFKNDKCRCELCGNTKRNGEKYCNECNTYIKSQYKKNGGVGNVNS